MKLSYRDLTTIVVMAIVAIIVVIVSLNRDLTKDAGFRAGMFFVLFLVFSGLIVTALITKKAYYRSSLAKRDEQPFSYWSTVVMMFVIGIASGVVSAVSFINYLRN